MTNFSEQAPEFLSEEAKFEAAQEMVKDWILIGKGFVSFDRKGNYHVHSEVVPGEECFSLKGLSDENIKRIAETIKLEDLVNA